MAEVVRVNFGQPIPLFPLPDTVLLPHAVLPLHVFEPRYRQMVNHVLDRSGQLAMAMFQRESTCGVQKHVQQTNGLGAKGAPSLRPAVCIGQIIQHEALADGRHNILLHGVCRAQIIELQEPDGERMYRQAVLRPLERVDMEPPPMPAVREHLRSMLHQPGLQRVRCIESLLEWLNREEVSTHALLELIGFALVRDVEMRYQLLEERCANQRARLIFKELGTLEKLVHRAEQQSFEAWPKGVSWN